MSKEHEDAVEDILSEHITDRAELLDLLYFLDISLVHAIVVVAAEEGKLKDLYDKAIEMIPEKKLYDKDGNDLIKNPFEGNPY